MTKPKLRFKEFNDDWNNLLLKEFCIINPNNNKTLPNTFFYIDLESVINGQIAYKLNAINKDNAPSRAARILQVNDLLYQTVRPYQRNNYLFSNELELPTVASTGYAQIRTTKNSIKFLYQLIHTDTFVNNVMKRCTGTSYPAINSTDLSNIIISVPNIYEQEKIAGFLSKVDELINECEGEVKDLEEQKKGLMQKIFSQQIRFKDSNKNPYPDWEEKKIGDVFNISAGGDIDKKHCTKEKTDTNTYPVYANALTNNGLYGYTNCYKIKNPAITVTGRGDVGHAVSRKEPFYPIVRLLVLQPKQKLDIDFYTYAINRTRIFVESTGVPQLTSPQIAKVKIFVPCLEEQEKIAKVLSKMDELIEEKKALLSDWQQFKKGLLQQMFV